MLHNTKGKAHVQARLLVRGRRHSLNGKVTLGSHSPSPGSRISCVMVLPHHKKEELVELQDRGNTAGCKTDMCVWYSAGSWGWKALCM